MKVRSLTPTGDWSYGQGLGNYKTNADAVTQNIQTRLGMFANDCFFSMSGWIDWFNLLGSKNQQAIQLFVTNLILNTSYVNSITSFSLIITGRTMTVNYTVQTAYGVISTTGLPIGVPTSYLLTQSGSILTTEGGSGLPGERSKLPLS